MALITHLVTWVREASTCTQNGHSFSLNFHGLIALSNVSFDSLRTVLFALCACTRLVLGPLRRLRESRMLRVDSVHEYTPVESRIFSTFIFLAALRFHYHRSNNLQWFLFFFSLPSFSDFFSLSISLYLPLVGGGECAKQWIEYRWMYK